MWSTYQDRPRNCMNTIPNLFHSNKIRSKQLGKYIGSANIIKKTILLKLTYLFSVIPIKLPKNYLIELEKLTEKFTLKEINKK